LIQRWAKPGRRMINTYGPTEVRLVVSHLVSVFIIHCLLLCIMYYVLCIMYYLLFIIYYFFFMNFACLCIFTFHVLIFFNSRTFYILIL
jgi:hypothetical protein